MAKKQKQARNGRPTGRVIDLNALLGNWPTIEWDGASFTGRHVNQPEKLAWLEAEKSGDADAQRAWLVAALNARDADVTDEWVRSQPDVVLVALVKGLHGLGWPGEEGAEGN